jgi:hypothetical protein
MNISGIKGNACDALVKVFEPLEKFIKIKRNWSIMNPLLNLNPIPLPISLILAQRQHFF